ncbi:hypothetical protein Cgig2_016337 [Carnegiea gigantea]|uniref:HVA22-like protein n=1 Tax=Carnegiea gigantea TaxID=171969 RepID=A0A9Q1Q7S5_9CARY|nr:hypothetical protein Cgig2_016337 [Carnegiea gigantea]
MLGDFINRGLVMILGYAYPAFECFKTVERNKVDIEELRFWCQYWMIIAALSVVERIGDLFISWVPFYGEMKVAFIVYLWYPKTKSSLTRSMKPSVVAQCLYLTYSSTKMTKALSFGLDYVILKFGGDKSFGSMQGSTAVYESLFKPLVAKHESDIDTKIQELKLRAWDLIVYHWQHCAHVGQAAFFNAVQYVLQQSYKMKVPYAEQAPADQKAASPPPTPVAERAPSTPTRQASSRNLSQSASRRWPPADQQSTVRSSFKARTAQTDFDEAQTEYVHVDEVPESPGSSPKRKFGPVGSIKRRTQIVQ